MKKFAIIGYSHILPNGIEDEDQLWDILYNRTVSNSEPSLKYGKSIYKDDDKSLVNKIINKTEGIILNNNDLKFNPSLFNLSNLEAKNLDPRQSMMLKCCWETLEKAGIVLNEIKNEKIGVFIGAQDTYNIENNEIQNNKFSISGSSSNMISNRVSYSMNLTGPSLTVMTACSSSFYALHTCLNSILQGDCYAGFVGGINYNNDFSTSIGFSKSEIISPSGVCSPFDINADGYIRCEGCISFLIKRLDLALNDKNKIYGVISGCCANNAGSANNDKNFNIISPERNIISPTSHSLVEVIKKTIDISNSSIDEIDYIESHSTGTQIGDIIEGMSINMVFDNLLSDNKVKLSSIKSNLGHMESASFTLSLLKILLMIKKKNFLPISKSFNKLNPKIEFKNVEILTTNEKFSNKVTKFLINNSGFGGANGCCLVEEYNDIDTYEDNVEKYNNINKSEDNEEEINYMIPLSAKNNDDLKEYIKSLVNKLKKKNFKIYDIASNLSLKRTHYENKYYIVSDSTEKFIKKCEELKIITNSVHNDNKIVFLFPGQGSQYVGCCKILYEKNSIFKNTIDYVDTFWIQHKNISLKNIAFGSDKLMIDRPEYSQPIIFMIQIALIEYYKFFGIIPTCIIGHSLGEFACLYISEILRLDDILKILIIRSNIQSEIYGEGNMLSVNLSEEELNSLLIKNNKDFIYDIGAVNSFDSIVISSDVNTILKIKEFLDEKCLFNTIIKGNISFHSSYLDKLKEKFMIEILKLNLSYKNPQIPIISTVYGDLLEYCNNDYIWLNMREQVKFYDSILKAKELYDNIIFLELSPTPTLKYYINKIESTFVSSLNKNISENESLQISIGELYSNNIVLNFINLYKKINLITEKLPLYPNNTIIERNLFSKKNNNLPLLGKQMSKSMYTQFLSQNTHNWLLGHCINNNAIMPFAGYVEMILESINKFPINIEYINCINQLDINDNYYKIIVDVKNSDLDNEIKFITIKSYDLNDFENETIHCEAKINNNNIKKIETFDEFKIPDDLEKVFFNYEKLKLVSNYFYNYKNNFLVVKEIYRKIKTNILYLTMEIDNDFFKNCYENGYLINPCLLDGVFQSSIRLIFSDPDATKGYPKYIKNACFYNKINSNIIKVIFNFNFDFNEDIKGQILIKSGTRINGSFTIYNNDGSVVGNIEKYYSTSMRNVEIENTHYQLILQPKIYPETKNILFDNIDNFIFNNLKINNNYFHRILNILDKNIVKINDDKIFNYDINNYEYIYVSENNDLINNYLIKYLEIKKIKFRYFDNTFKNIKKKNFFDFIILNDEININIDIINDIIIDNGYVISNFEINECSSLQLINMINYKYIYQKKNYYIYQNNVINKKEKVILFGNTIGIFNELYKKLLNNYDIIFTNIEYFKNNIYDNLYKIFYFINDPSKYAVNELDELIEISKIVDNNYINKINLWIFTNTKNNANSKNIDNGCLIGFMKSLNLELINIIRLYMIDFKNVEDIDVINNLINADLEEIYFTIQDKIPKVNRLINLELEYINLKDYELKIKNIGLKDLNIVQKIPKELGDYEILIENKAAALNFRDLMIILDKLHPEACDNSSVGNEIGMECCGIIKKVGKYVKNFTVDMDVIALSKKCFSNTVSCNEETVFIKPNNLNYSEGSSVLSVYITAYYAIVEIANLKKGDSILIHSAMGGVGQAAINISKVIGLEIFTTVGNDEKKKKLEELGIKYIFNSHSYEWSNELLKIKKNGVNAILNSLSGKHIQLNLETLSSEGWLLEIGKVDIYNNNKIEMGMFKKNIGFRAIDIDRLIIDNPTRIKNIANICLNYLKNNIYHPIIYTNYNFKDYKLAFNKMLKGDHFGKIVINNFDDVNIKLTNFNLKNVNINKYLNGTFIISGGFGGIGIAVVKYIMSMGASKIVLISHINDNIDIYNNKETIIIIEKGNISDYSFVEYIIDKYKENLTGIIHLAGILSDYSYEKQNKKTYLEVLEPKAIGAWNLHEASINSKCNIKYFLMSSSIVSVFGNKGQTTYGAANSYLDLLNNYRNELSLPSICINIPVILNAGMGFNSKTKIIDITNKIGILAISTYDLITSIDYAMRYSVKNIIHLKTKNINMDLNTFGYNNLGMLSSNNKNILNKNNSKESIIKYITDAVTNIVGIVDIDKLLIKCGLDSLLMVEFGSIIQNFYNIQIHQNIFFKHSINSLTDYIYDLINEN